MWLEFYMTVARKQLICVEETPYGVIEACDVGLRGARLMRLLALMALILVGSPTYLA